ncbi:MAG: HD family phosphohydrolase [Planctomycetota bacterium]|jgi:putative nucleotidyltransferase with HDIG domain
MWPFKTKIKQRRLEVRKSIQTAEVSVWAKLRASVGIVPMLLGVALLLGAVLLDAWPLDPFTYRMGQYIPSDIHARVAFSTYPTETLRKDKETARRGAPGVFRLDTALLDEILTTLRAAPDQFAPPAPVPSGNGNTDKSSPATEIEGLAPLPVAPERREHWQTYAAGERRTAYDQWVDELQEALPGIVVVSKEELDAEEERQTVRYFHVLIDRPAGDGWERKKALFVTSTDKEKHEEVREQLTRLAWDVDEAIRPDIEEYLFTVLISRPLYRRDEQASRQEIVKAIAAVEADPPTIHHSRGERLVSREIGQARGGQCRLTGEEYELLLAEHEAFGKMERTVRPWRLWGRFVGRATVLLGMTLALAVFIYRYHRRIVSNPWRALAMVCLMLVVLAVSKLLGLVLGWPPLLAVLPVMTATVILVVAYDQRLAMFVGLLSSAMVTFLLRENFSTFLVLATATTCSALLLHEIRSRSRLIEVAGVAAAVVFVTACLLGRIEQIPWLFVLPDAFWAALAAVAVGFVVQGILPVIEKVFNIATSMTLLEWCDASKPLLKRLAMEAPGTYNHSLQLGTMCEAAAEAIGARGLLARVGAYYHDIGKINKPKYFVENSGDSSEMHNKLSPEMSKLIITGHVKDGIEMAREYGLPSVLHEFIATHHGTTVAQYFFHVATEQRRNGDGPPPEESEFRYPGPKPRSKETGIFMLGDASESSVRSMTDPTPGRIEGQVHTMVTRRLMDGQLDECDLTLQEVHRIEQSLVKSLCAVYHARIAYPKPAGEKTASPAEESARAPKVGGADGTS